MWILSMEPPVLRRDRTVEVELAEGGREFLPRKCCHSGNRRSAQS
ncbi:MAG: hypothetical protein ACLTBV_18840 [Enterocloster bolteae]